MAQVDCDIFFFRDSDKWYFEFSHGFPLTRSWDKVTKVTGGQMSND